MVHDPVLSKAGHEKPRFGKSGWALSAGSLRPIFGNITSVSATSSSDPRFLYFKA
ncbi:MAG: hypothetical protein ACI8Z1_002595 [Candidatus Azotimanducaceae bacterium]|jgi:hypothetical protein